MLDTIITKFLTFVASNLPKQTLLSYLARFEYGSYLYYQRRSNYYTKQAINYGSGIWETAANLLEAIAKSEYNHHVALSRELPNFNYIPYEVIRLKDPDTEWNMKIGERADSISTRWLSLRYFFKGKPAKDFTLLDTLCFIQIIEEFQCEFYLELCKTNTEIESIYQIVADERNNSDSLLWTLHYNYPHLMADKLKQWNRRKLITYLLIPFDLLLEYCRVQLSELLTEMDDIYWG